MTDEEKKLINTPGIINGNITINKAIEMMCNALDELEAYRAIGTVEEFKALKVKEHNYDNCHNYTCRKKCEKDGYAKAIDEFANRLASKIKSEIDDCADELEWIDEIAEKIKNE